MSDIYFKDYADYCFDYECLIEAEAESKLKVTLDDYLIKEKTLMQFFRDDIDIMMTVYETLHDQILLELDYFKPFEIIIQDDIFELWGDYESYIKIDWEKLSNDTARSYKNNDITIYGIRKVRREVAKLKGITTNKLTYFVPLKESYERKYYKPKEKYDGGE